MIIPTYLKKGDTVAIIAPAKAIEKEVIDNAVELWKRLGYTVLVGEHCFGRDNYFSGTIDERTQDLQWAINHDKVKAVVCARGGYGCIHTVERVDWGQMKKNPKWMIGFSDVTVFHFLFSIFRIASVHGTMPLNYKENTRESLTKLNQLLRGDSQKYEWKSSLSVNGACEGELIGGNLAVISDLIGTKLQPDMKGKILFLEEVGEYHYTIDRMFYQLKFAGVLAAINGLVLGSFTNVGDSTPPFGESIDQILFKHTRDLSIPVAFDFPLGHQADNRPLKCGGQFSFSVNNGRSILVEI